MINKLKRNLKLIFIVSFILLVPFTKSYSFPITVYGNIGGGTSIIESSINGFYLKSMPTFSSGITIIGKRIHKVNLGLEIDVLYTLRSNYNDYFFYGPFMEIALSPILEVDLLKILTIGIMGTIAPTYTNFENTIDLKIGSYLLIPIKTKWLKYLAFSYY